MQAIIGYAVKALIEYLVKLIANIIANAKRLTGAKKAAEEQAAADTKKLEEIKPNTSSQEVDSGIEEASKHF